MSSKNSHLFGMHCVATFCSFVPQHRRHSRRLRSWDQVPQRQVIDHVLDLLDLHECQHAGPDQHGSEARTLYLSESLLLRKLSFLRFRIWKPACTSLTKRLIFSGRS